MPAQVFIGPLTGSGDPDDPIRFKYHDFTQNWVTETRLYQAEQLAIFLIDEPQSTIDAMVATFEGDVFSFPQNLDQTPSAAQRQALEDILELHNFPGNWIQQPTQLRVTLRELYWMMAYFQRVWSVLKVSFFTGGVTLNTQWQNFPTVTQDTLQLAATISQYDFSSVVDTTLLRALVKMMADQKTGVPYVLNSNYII